MTDLELLTNSCKRLPRLVELKAPPCILVSELRILSDLSFAALQESMHADFNRRMTERRAAKAVPEEPARDE